MSTFRQQLETRLRQPGVTYFHLQSLAVAAGITLEGSGDTELAISQLLDSADVFEANPSMLVLLPPDVIQEAAEAEREREEAVAAANAAEKTQRIQRLREALDTSTKVNRTLSLSFVALMFYILLIVASTTDLQLFLPESTVRLPILDVELPLLAFYTVVPFIIVIFHFHLLINLKHHQDKYRLWRAEVGSDGRSTQLDPILINFLDTYPRWHPLRILLVAVISVSVFYFPFVDIVLMQWRFGDYHSFAISTMNFGAAMLDGLMIIGFFHHIFNRMKRSDSKGRRWMIGKAGMPAFFVSLLLESPRRITRIFGWFFGRDWILYSGIAGSVLVWMIAIKLWLMLDDPGAMAWISTKWLPRIDLTNQAHLVGQVSDAYVLNYMRDSLSEADARAKANANFGKSINLRGRDLRFSVLTQVNLSRCMLSEANLSNSNLEFATLDQSVMPHVNLTGAICYGASFQEASLPWSKLLCADLSGSNFQGADIKESQLDGSLIRGAQFQGVDAFGASLIGCDLTNTNFDGACMFRNVLYASNLSSATFRGTDLTASSLQLAHLSYSDFRAADLSGIEVALLRCCDNSCDSIFTTAELLNYDDMRGPDWDSILQEIDRLNIVEDVAYDSPPFPKPLKRMLQQRIRIELEAAIDVSRECNRIIFHGVDKYVAASYLPNIACSNTFSARRILDWGLNFEEELKDSVLSQMCLQCNEIIKKLKREYPELVIDAPCLK